jgi:hypothetical protein
MSAGSCAPAAAGEITAQANASAAMARILMRTRPTVGAARGAQINLV